MCLVYDVVLLSMMNQLPIWLDREKQYHQQTETYKLTLHYMNKFCSNFSRKLLKPKSQWQRILSTHGWLRALEVQVWGAWLRMASFWDANEGHEGHGYNWLSYSPRSCGSWLVPARLNGAEKIAPLDSCYWIWFLLLSLHSDLYLPHSFPWIFM